MNPVKNAKKAIWLAFFFSCCGTQSLFAQYLQKLTNINYYGINGLAPINLTVFNNKLYFFGTNHKVYANMLFSYDDATDAVTMIKQIDTVHKYNGLYNLSVLGNKLLFQDDHMSELWVSDGTELGTKVLKKLIIAYEVPYTLFNGKMYFAGDSSFTGTFADQLWETDGTPAGTKMVKKINPTGPCKMRALTAWNGNLYFAATDGTNNRQLWISDGTENGTKLLKTLYPSGDALPMGFTPVGDKLVFAATVSGTYTRQLFSTDGTAAGTMQITHVNGTGKDGMNPQNFTIYNGLVYFSGYDTSYNAQLWRTDGTKSGTTVVKRNYQSSGVRGLFPTNLWVHKGNLYFSGIDSLLGYQLWKSDGTTFGTNLVTRFGYHFQPKKLASLADWLIMVGYDSLKKKDEVFASDGTFKGTFRPEVPNDWSSAPLYPIDKFVLYNNALYYCGAYAVFSDYQLCRVNRSPVKSQPNTIAENIFYPNPTTGNLYLEQKYNAALSLHIFDIYGKTVLQTELNSNQNNLNISNLSDGIYYLKIKNNTTIWYQKVIKASK